MFLGAESIYLKKDKWKKNPESIHPSHKLLIRQYHQSIPYYTRENKTKKTFVPVLAIFTIKYPSYNRVPVCIREDNKVANYIWEFQFLPFLHFVWKVIT